MSEQSMKAERLALYLAHRDPHPKCRCNFCGLTVPPRALWCSTLCAMDYQAERQKLTAR